jgi:hypothetical protein
LLAGCGGRPTPVPEKERSLEIFGDEKRISQNLRNGLLLGTVPLSLLGAVRVHAPIPHATPDANGRGRPLLLVENEDSFASLRRWNAARARFSAIAYVAGNGFRKSSAGLDALAAEVGASELRYLGDIDPKGLAIPSAVSAARVAEGLLPILPEETFYAWLLENGLRREDPGAGKRDLSGAAWLPPSLAGKALDVMRGDLRIPQEALGTIVLSTDFS